MIRSILFVTSTNLATNPRCVKEIQLALEEGIEVKVLACELGGWSQLNESTIQQTLGEKVEIRYVDVTRVHKINWLISSFIEKLCQFLFKNFKSHSLRIISYAFSKRSYLLARELNRWRWIPSLIIAHNPPAFYPAYNFAKSKKILFAVDVEDYHPGEQQALIKKELITRIMRVLLPLASYLSFASSLIEGATLKLVGPTLKRNVVIYNNFHKGTFLFKSDSGEKVRLVWFSQNINEGRGLELVVQAVYEKRDKLQLILIGNLNHSFYTHFLSQYSDCLVIKQPMSQSELNLDICNYDVGLAIEPGKDDNNLIALSNKIWTYYQAGLFIMATDTPAQVLFIQNNPGHGVVVNRSKEAIAVILSDILKKYEAIRGQKQDRFFRAQNVSWEKESEKLIEIWNEVIH